MNIVIIFGGSSFEHEISIVSTITLKKVLKSQNLDFVFVDANRDMYHIDADNLKSSYFSSGDYKKSKRVYIQKGGFYTLGLMGSKKSLDCDVVLNLIHGRDGEDGKIASLMEFYSISYIGPRVEASAISYSKILTKLYAKSVGIEVLPYEVLYKKGTKEIKTKRPFIIKPVHLGSSIGVSIVKDGDDLNYALDVAFEFDDTVIIEPFIEGISEYNLAGCKSSVWELSIVEEPHKDEFLDFDKKYMDFSRDNSINEASIDNVLKNRMIEAFEKIYSDMFEGSIIRCDFFVIDDKIYLNEINPIPGSMANYLFKDFENMIERLAKVLPKERNITIDYKYIHSIQSAKGKA